MNENGGAEKEEDDGEEEEEERHHRQQVWSWGAGTDGQLGTTNLQDEIIPRLLLPSDFFGRISLLSCGGAHVIALTSNGSVWTWGRGSSGQLGHGEMVNCLQPELVKSLETHFVTHVSAGWNHSGFVTDKGHAFTCGDGSFGQLGHGDFKTQSLPVMLSHFPSEQIDQIACGMRHTLVLLKGGFRDSVYGVGFGKRGQLGISKDKIGSICHPQRTIGLDDLKIVSIHANGDHSVALCDDGSLYTWGREFDGRSATTSPQCLSSSLCFTQVALGWNHALLLTVDGHVYKIGKHHGEVSDCRRMNLVEPLHEESNTLVLDRVSVEEEKLVQVAAGAEHSAIVTESGLVMTWGWGEHGQLGLGNTNDETIPTVVDLGYKLFDSPRKTRVYCGSGFTYAVITPLPSQTCDQSTVAGRRQNIVTNNINII